VNILAGMAVMVIACIVEGQNGDITFTLALPYESVCIVGVIHSERPDFVQMLYTIKEAQQAGDINDTNNVFYRVRTFAVMMMPR